MNNRVVLRLGLPIINEYETSRQWRASLAS
jgi:hypothetical protein